MSIESSVPSDSSPLAEPNTIEAWLSGRYFEGKGFDELSQALAKRLSVLTNSIHEKRPLYFVTKSDNETADLFSLSALVEEIAESLAIPLESNLTAYLELSELDDRAAQQIVEDRRRPLIQPLAVGSSEHPDWWLGPIWIFPTPGPVDVFRHQLAEIQLQHEPLNQSSEPDADIFAK